MNDYVQVRLRPTTEMAEAVEFVAFVHRILCTEDENQETSFLLLASRYSFLGSFNPFCSAQQLIGPISRKELLLHFTDFNTMGERQDAEIIPVSEIIEAGNLEFNPAPYADPVQLVARPPEGMNKFCLLPD
jgi:hypothetical protein